jgi:hypothetical protein
VAEHGVECGSRKGEMTHIGGLKMDVLDATPRCFGSSQCDLRRVEVDAEYLSRCSDLCQA